MPPKSKLGQNFLRDRQAIARIAAAAGDVSNHIVVEIGPGRAAITHQLLDRVREANRNAADTAATSQLVCIEFDHALAADLRIQFLVSAPEVTIIEKSILDFDLTALSHELGKRLVIVGNLPYYITSDILLHLAVHHAVIERAVLMVQREVAERVTAEPGSRDYGVLSTSVQLYGPADMLFTLPPEAFSPPPEVHSTVFRWRIAPLFAQLDVEPTEFIAFLKRAFAQKRKTLANNLKNAGFTPATIDAAYSDAGIQPQARAETLSIAEFAKIFNSLKTI